MNLWKLAWVGVLLAAAGCERGPRSTEEPDIKGGIGKRLPIVGRQYLRGDLHELGRAYLLFVTTSGRAPQSFDDVKDAFRGNPAAKRFEEGEYVVYWGAEPDRLPQGASKTVLAYPADALEGDATTVVLMADGSLHDMTPGELNAAPKAGD